MAKGFRFRLEKLLDIRKEQEEESKRLFSESQNKKLMTEKELASLKESYENYRGIKPGEDVIYQKIKKNYLMVLTESIKDKEKELTVRIRDLEFKRDELKNRQMERKTVEVLKDKEYLNFVKEQDRLEQLQLDEIALYAYMRNGKGGEKNEG